MELFYEILERNHDKTQSLIIFTNSNINIQGYNTTIKKLQEYKTTNNNYGTYAFFLTEDDLDITKTLVDYINTLKGKNVILKVPKHFDYDYFIKNINSFFVDSFKRNVPDQKGKFYFIYSVIKE